MKLSFKDIISVTAITILSFPALYLCVLFATGNARLQFGHKQEEVKRTEDLRVMNLTHRRDSLMAMHSESYRAMLKQSQELEEKERQLKDREDRVSMLERELEQQKQELAQQRSAIEKAVSASDQESVKKVRQLARVYGAMRPAEAAQILETLNDDLVVQVLNGIGDERQKGKVMAALSKEKAVRISRIMGAPAVAKGAEKQ
jgi:flagellar motility protein MotE (MotC chaperone)